jgi:flagellar motor switch protein FliN/FliY
MADATPESTPDPLAAAQSSGLVESNDPALSEAVQGESSGSPTISSGLLKIRVPIRVTLASQRKTIQEIVELGPGSIVKFEKTCDEPLELSVGDLPFATGEVVKVGDKFGLRLGARK